MAAIDWAILAIDFLFVLGVGAALRRFTRTSTDFFLAGRALPAWVCGLAFISANLGTQEVIGMAASGAKYGVATGHFYWIGAIPAMVFVGIYEKSLGINVNLLWGGVLLAFGALMLLLGTRRIPEAAVREPQSAVRDSQSESLIADPGTGPPGRGAHRDG